MCHNYIYPFQSNNNWYLWVIGIFVSDVNKDLTFKAKDKDKDQTLKAKDQDKNQTYKDKDKDKDKD